MTDYEEKFHNMGTKINRCVAVKGSSPSLYWRRTLREA